MLLQYLLLFLIGSVFAFGPDDLTAAEVKKGCAKGVHIIDIRGEGATPDGHGYGITRPLVEALRHAVPHSTNISVSYPEQGTTPQSNPIAVKHMKAHISEYVKKCPHTKIVLSGYSEGAGVTLNTICGTTNPGFSPTPPLSTKYHNNILAVVTYGDYTHHSGQPYNRGSCKHSSKWPRGNPATCKPWYDKLRSVCHAGDPICCSTGTNQTQHYTYFKKNDPYIAKFVRGRFQHWKRSQRHQS